MTTLHGGTVTFVFTDVEGSTKLLHELGPEGYAQALAGHRRVPREAGDGNLDTNFGTGGKVLTEFAGYDFALAVTIQSDGMLAYPPLTPLSGHARAS